MPEILKDLMKKRGLSTRDLAKAVGVPQSTIASFLSTKPRNPRLEHVKKVADFLGVSIDYLAFGEEKASLELQELLTEKMFSGFLKVNIERVIPAKRSTKTD